MQVKLTWDEDDVHRKRVLGRRPAADELKDDDFKARRAGEEPVVSQLQGFDHVLHRRTSRLRVIRRRATRLSRCRTSTAHCCRAQRTSGGLTARAGGGLQPRCVESACVQVQNNRHVDNVGTWKHTHVGRHDACQDVLKKYGHDCVVQEDEAAEKPEPGVAEDKGMEMEVTFAPGLDSLGKKILDKARQAKGSEGETVWEAYMRRKRDKRRLAKELGKARADSDTSDEDGEGDEPAAAPAADPFDDPFFNVRKTACFVVTVCVSLCVPRTMARARQLRRMRKHR